MWPFKKKHKEPEPDYTQEAIDRLKAFKDIGEKFNYLGVEMIVTHHHEISLGLNYGIDLIATLKADYRNNLGEIKSVSFSPGELPALIAENN